MLFLWASLWWGKSLKFHNNALHMCHMCLVLSSKRSPHKKQATEANRFRDRSRTSEEPDSQLLLDMSTLTLWVSLWKIFSRWHSIPLWLVHNWYIQIRPREVVIPPRKKAFLGAECIVQGAQSPGLEMRQKKIKNNTTINAPKLMVMTKCTINQIQGV